MRIWAFFLRVLLVGFPSLLHADDHTLLMTDGAKRSIAVNVGLIAEMGSREGKVVHSFVSMALKDFSNLNKGFRTSIALHVRDSKGDSLQSIAAALDLLENVEVQAIIIPSISNEELFLARLGGKVNVPLLSFSSLSSSNQHPYFIQAAEDEVNQFHGIANLMKQLNWKSFVFLCEDTADARLSQTYIQDIFEENHSDIVYQRTYFSLQTTDDEIIDKLQKLKRTKASIFVVHLSPSLTSQVFVNAKNLGMTSAGFAWIVTSKTMNFLEPQDSSLCESMQGVLGFKSYIPMSSKLQNLTRRWRREFEKNESNLKVREPNIVALWAYDAAWVLAEAIEKTGLQPSQTQSEVMESKKLYSSRMKVSTNGPSILSKIISTKFTGLAGEFQLKNRKLVPGAYEIQNIICKVERRVGFWTGAYGLTKDIVFYKNLSSDNLDIIWPGFSLTVPQRRLMATSGKRFKVGVPAHSGFRELVDISHDPESNAPICSGFSIDVFHAALDRLSDKMLVDYVVFDTENGTYNDFVQQVYLQNIDAAVGDITILSNRSAFVDFTVPYSELGVGVMVKIDNDPWFFLRPFSPELWIVIACSFVLMGFTIWLIEHRINEEFQGSPTQQIGAILWFAVSTLFYAHREQLRSNASRFVGGVWFFIVLILTSSYTANLSSLLTVAQFKLAKSPYIGYKGSSFLGGMIVKNNLNFGNDLLTPYEKPEQFYDALRKGRKDGGVDAIMEEVPYIRALVARHPHEFSMVKSSPTTSGFGFAFPKGSPLVHEMSRAIEVLREEGKLLEMEKKWFKRRSMLFDQDNEPSKLNPLNIRQFAGLFFINGTSEFIAIAAFVIFVLRERLSSFSFTTLVSTEKLRDILRYFHPRMDDRIPRPDVI